jgi:hypothetical protein
MRRPTIRTSPARQRRGCGRLEAAARCGQILEVGGSAPDSHSQCPFDVSHLSAMDPVFELLALELSDIFHREHVPHPTDHVEAGGPIDLPRETDRRAGGAHAFERDGVA